MLFWALLVCLYFCYVCRDLPGRPRLDDHVTVPWLASRHAWLHMPTNRVAPTEPRRQWPSTADDHGRLHLPSVLPPLAIRHVRTHCCCCSLVWRLTWDRPLHSAYLMPALLFTRRRWYTTSSPMGAWTSWPWPKPWSRRTRQMPWNLTSNGCSYCI